MVREGVNWYYVYNATVTVPDEEEERSFTYLYRVNFEGDTVMNGGRTYKKMYMTFVEPHEYIENCKWPVAWFRETDKRVYAVINKHNPYVQSDEKMTLAGPRYPTEDYDSTGEYLLFDFNNISATYNSSQKNSLKLIRSDSDLVIDGYKRVTYDERSVDTWSKDTTYTHYVAEGYGAIFSNGNYIFPVQNLYGYPKKNWTIGLTHITNENGDIIHKTWRYDTYNDYLDLCSVGNIKTDQSAKISFAQGTVTAESATNGILYLYSMSGTLVCEQNGQANASCKISTDGLTPGIYVAVWRDPRSTVSHKIIVR